MNTPPLICLHGSGDSAQAWDTVIAALGTVAPGTLALDLPGHGARAHEPPPQPHTIAAYVNAVLADLDRRGQNEVILVGHSLGSAIALQLAVDEPQRVRGIVLVGAGARLRVLPAILELARNDPPAAQRQLLTLAYAPANEPLAEGYLAREQPIAPAALYSDLAACDGFDVMARLSEIHQPALVLVGEGDRLTPPKYATYLAEHLRASTLTVIPNAGHMLMDEAPIAVARAIGGWLVDSNFNSSFSRSS